MDFRKDLLWDTNTQESSTIGGTRSTGLNRPRAHSRRGNYAAAEADGPSFPSIDEHAAIADRLMCGPIILVIAARLG